MNDKTKHKYLVGFTGDNQCVYGKDVFDEKCGYISQYCSPMTIHQVTQLLKKFHKPERVAIYQLVPIKINDSSVNDDVIALNSVYEILKRIKKRRWIINTLVSKPNFLEAKDG
jgi:hypothetical protein